MSLLYRLVLLAGLVFFTANVSLAETASYSDLPNYSDLPKYFKILLDSPAEGSPEFYSVLSWVEKVEQQQPNLSLSEAQKIKMDVDNLIQEQLSFKNVSTFSTLVHQSGIHNIYNMIPVKGKLYDYIALVEGHINSAKLTEQDVKILSRVLSTSGLKLNKLQTFLKPLSEFVPDGKIYNGFPSIHLPSILSSGLRSGLAYGPPGSVQLEGIFTTAKKQNSIDWGLIKSQSFGATSETMSAHLLSIQVSPAELVLDLPLESSEMKSKLLRAGNEVGLNENYKKLSDYAKFLIDRESGKTIKFSIILALLDVKLYRTTIYRDVNNPMGKEVIVVDRRAITESHIENTSGDVVSGKDFTMMVDLKKKLRIQFSENLDRYMTQGQIKEAVKLFNLANFYFINTPSAMSVAMENLSDVQRKNFIEAVMADYHFKNLSLIAPQLIKDHQLLSRPEIRNAIKHYLQLKFDKTIGFRQLKYEQLEEKGFTQRFVFKYLKFIELNYPGELEDLVKVINLRSEPSVHINKCMAIYS